ncbi:MAG TPA: choice-of-anchor E domain-containing protein [Burkholderiales bacterium]|nr:choice-of-anchor E domain-containing protein [Burkholderiales bacterium]
MTISGKAVAALALVALLTTGVERAQAAIVSETESFLIGGTPQSLQPGGDTALLNFNQFNSVLGTLTAVDFVLDSFTVTVVSVFALGSGSATNTSSFEVQVNPTFGTIFGPHVDSVNASCSTIGFPPTACSSFPSISAQFFSDSFTVPAGDVDDFVGSGSFDATLLFQISLVATCPPGLCSPSGNILWDGTLTVHYTFEPAGAVTEPTTLMLLGAGLGGLALARRRKGLSER